MAKRLTTDYGVRRFPSPRRLVEPQTRRRADPQRARLRLALEYLTARLPRCHHSFEGDHRPLDRRRPPGSTTLPPSLRAAGNPRIDGAELGRGNAAADVDGATFGDVHREHRPTAVPQDIDAAAAGAGIGVDPVPDPVR